MRTLLSGIAAVAAVAFFASSTMACEWNKARMASKVKSSESVAMSTYDGAKTPAAELSVEALAKPECAEGDKDCAPQGQ